MRSKTEDASRQRGEEFTLQISEYECNKIILLQNFQIFGGMNSNSIHQMEEQEMHNIEIRKNSPLLDFAKGLQIFLFPKNVEELDLELLKGCYYEVYSDLQKMDISEVTSDTNYKSCIDLIADCHKFCRKEFSIDEAVQDITFCTLRKLRILLTTQLLQWICEIITQRVTKNLKIGEMTEQLITTIEQLSLKLFEDYSGPGLRYLTTMLEEDFNATGEFPSEEDAYYSLLHSCLKLVKLFKDKNLDLEAESLFSLIENNVFDLLMSELPSQRIFGCKLLTMMMLQCDLAYQESLAEFYLDLFKKETIGEEQFSLILRTLFINCKSVTVRIKILEALRERNTTKSQIDFLGLFDTDFFECYVESEIVDEELKISQTISKKFLDDILSLTPELLEHIKSFLSVYILPRFENIIQQLTVDSSVVNFTKYQDEITQLVQLISVK